MRTASVVTGVAVVMWIIWVILRQRTPLPARHHPVTIGRVVPYPGGDKLPRACSIVLSLEPSVDGTEPVGSVLVAGLHVWDGMGHEITPPARTSSGIVRRRIAGTSERLVPLHEPNNKPHDDLLVARILLQKLGDSPLRIALRDSSGSDIWVTTVRRGTLPSIIEFVLGRPEYWIPYIWDAECDPSVLNPSNAPAAVDDKVARWITIDGLPDTLATPSVRGGIHAAVWNHSRLMESRDGRLAVRCDRACTLLGAPGFPGNTLEQFNPFGCAIFIVFEVLGSPSVTHDTEPLHVFFVRPHTSEERAANASSFPLDKPPPTPLYTLCIERDPRTGRAIFLERLRTDRGSSASLVSSTAMSNDIPNDSATTCIVRSHKDTPVHGHRLVYAAQYALQPNGTIEHRSMLQRLGALHRATQPAPNANEPGTEYHMVFGCIGGCTDDPSFQRSGGAVAYHEIRIYPQTMNDGLLQSVHEEMSQKWDAE